MRICALIKRGNIHHVQHKNPNSKLPFLVLRAVLLGAIIVCLPIMAAGADSSWQALQDQFGMGEQEAYGNRGAEKEIEKSWQTEADDPWKRLQANILSFSVILEERALIDPAVALKMAANMEQALSPYRCIIQDASARFDVPESVIGAVIMVESGANPYARAGTSTAKGLMQTIDSTFQAARAHLSAQGVEIENNPFDPHASIMAGSWYLSQMYKAAVADAPDEVDSREIITAWRRPLEYYYAGPGNGKKREDIVIIYADGRQVVIDKPGYSNKVLQWANIIKLKA